MSAKKTHWLRTTIIVLVICGIAGLALTSYRFFGNADPAVASATIVFTFEGAADGVAPNGTAYNTSGLTSDEVLNGALETAGLAGVYTADQLRENLVVRGVYPADMAGQVTSYESLLNFTANRELTVGDYHPTTFNVALSADFDKNISQANLEALMQGILTAYRAQFGRMYANGLERGNSMFDLDQYDYPQQLSIIQAELESMANYAAAMYERAPSFRHNGGGFNDVNVRYNNLIGSDIARLNADLTMNALTRDTSRLLTQYQFEIRDLTNQLEKQNARLEKMDALIESYDKNEIIYLSTTDSLTKIDGNSSETYDALVDQRKKVADGITEINSQITSYQLKLADLLKEETAEEKADASKPAATAAPAAAQSEAAEDGEETSAITEDVIAAEDIVAMTEEEIAAAAEEAERQARAQAAALEKNIAALVERGDAVTGDFQALLTAYNDQQINDLTVAMSGVRYNAPKLLSGAFAVKAIKTAGPICLLGFMACMVMIIISRKREEKEA